MASAVARHGSDRTAPGAAGRGCPQFRSSQSHAHEARDVHGQPRSWLRTCSATGSTITVAPNFALELAVRTSRRIGSLDLSRLRAIIVGSEAVRADTLERFAEAFGRRVFARWRSVPGTAWRRRRSRSRSCVRTSRGARSAAGRRRRAGRRGGARLHRRRGCGNRRADRAERRARRADRVSQLLAAVPVPRRGAVPHGRRLLRHRRHRG